MKTAVVILALVMSGCTTFKGTVADMREQAEMCTGEVTFKVAKLNGQEKVAYTCHWEETGGFDATE